MEQRVHHKFARAAVQLDGRRNEFTGPFLPRQARPAAAVRNEPERGMDGRKDDSIQSRCVTAAGVDGNSFDVVHGCSVKMVRRAKSLWRTRQWCGRLRTCRMRRGLGSPCASTPVGRHTIYLHFTCTSS